MMHFLELLAAAVLGSACTAWFFKVRPNASSLFPIERPVDAVIELDANLDVQLERAKTIPGAEAVLNGFLNKTEITQSDINKMAKQLNELERLARVNDVRRDLMLERFAPVTRRYAQEAMANLKDARRASSQGTEN